MIPKILYVDDEPDAEALVRLKFRKQIKEKSIYFVFANNGAEALEIVKQNPDIEIVFTDINMPKMDGLTLLAELAKISENIRTVIVSAYGDIKNIRTAMNRGAFDFLIKPIDLTDFEITLNRIVEHTEKLRKEREYKLRLQQELDASQKDMIYKLGEVVEVRSYETGNHVRRVSEYCSIIARECGFSEKETQTIKLASSMHDIGKVAIPDTILNKPDKLTPEEWEIMQTHAIKGYEILKDSKREILKAASIIALEHHEKFDGSGYPRGLSGEYINIMGRIVAIADVFDALGNKRVYKPA